MEIITTSAKETADFGRKFANSLKSGQVVALSGDLGSGKTTFSQGVLQNFGVTNSQSPTFIILRDYKLDKEANGIGEIYHVDLYRLEDNTLAEMVNLGITDLWTNKSTLFLIEWAQRLEKSHYPDGTIWIEFEYISLEERKITIS